MEYMEVEETGQSGVGNQVERYTVERMTKGGKLKRRVGKHRVSRSPFSP